MQGGLERAGAERILLSLVAHLDRERWHPEVAFLGRGPFVEEVEALGVPIVELSPPRRLREFWSWRSTSQEIAEAATSRGADLIHANGEKVSIFAARASKIAGIPSIAWLHDAPGAGGLTGSAAQFMLTRSGSDAVVTCARWLSEAFNERHAMGAQPIVNGIELDILPQGSNLIQGIKADRGWADDAVVVSHFARLQRWKGTHVFLKAAAEVSKSFDQARFLVVGDALFGREERYAGRLRRMTERLGLGDRVFFTGYRSDALEIMSGSDVVVHCSIRPDPFPTVVIEAMGLGRAIVATRTRGPEESLEHGSTGLLVAPRDHEGLAHAISELVASRDKRARLGDAAQRAAFKNYSASRMAREFEELYESVVSEHRAEPADAGGVA